MNALGPHKLSKSFKLVRLGRHWHARFIRVLTLCVCAVHQMFKDWRLPIFKALCLSGALALMVLTALDSEVSVSINIPVMQVGPPMQMHAFRPGQVGLPRVPAGHVEEAADHEVPTRDQLGDRAAGPARALKDGPHVPKPAKGAPQPKMKPQPKFGNIQSGAAGRALALAAAVARPTRSRPMR